MNCCTELRVGTVSVLPDKDELGIEKCAVKYNKIKPIKNILLVLLGSQDANRMERHSLICLFLCFSFAIKDVSTPRPT